MLFPPKSFVPIKRLTWLICQKPWIKKRPSYALYCIAGHIHYPPSKAATSRAVKKKRFCSVITVSVETVGVEGRRGMPFQVIGHSGPSYHGRAESRESCDGPPPANTCADIMTVYCGSNVALELFVCVCVCVVYVVCLCLWCICVCVCAHAGVWCVCVCGVFVCRSEEHTSELQSR